MRRLTVLVLIAVAVLAAGLPAAGAGFVWHDSLRLTDDRRLSQFPDVAVDNGVVHVVWESARGVDSSPTQVMYRRSADGGATWDPAVKLRGGVQDARPSIAVVGDTVHVAWVEESHAVMYRASHDAGATWSKRKRLSSALVGFRDMVDIAAWGETVHVVWGDTSRGNWDIFHRVSTDSGITWSGRRRISIDDGDSSHSASIAVRGNAVHAVWWHNPGLVQHRYSSDGGASWSPIAALENQSPTQAGPSVAIAKSAVVVAWIEWGEGLPDMRIGYRRSLDGGETWADERLMSARVSAQSVPNLAAVADRVHVVWAEAVGNRQEIFYRKSLDAGASWASLKRLTRVASNSRLPSVAEDAKSVHVVWQDDVDGNWEVYSRSRR